MLMFLSTTLLVLLFVCGGCFVAERDSVVVLNPYHTLHHRMTDRMTKLAVFEGLNLSKTQNSYFFVCPYIHTGLCEHTEKEMPWVRKIQLFRSRPCFPSCGWQSESYFWRKMSSRTRLRCVQFSACKEVCCTELYTPMAVLNLWANTVKVIHLLDTWGNKLHG